MSLGIVLRMPRPLMNSAQRIAERDAIAQALNTASEYCFELLEAETSEAQRAILGDSERRTAQWEMQCADVREHLTRTAGLVQLALDALTLPRAEALT